MALIGKIRNNMWLVFVIIALATISFILMDAQGPGGGGPTANTAIGEIAGQKITNNEFESAYRTIFNNSGDANGSRAALWNYFIEQKLVSGEADKMGLGIGSEELMDLQFGQNMSPVIRQYYSNPATGQMNIQALQDVKRRIESGDYDANFAASWKEIQKQIVKSQLQTKLNSLGQKAIYTPNWMAEGLHAEENGTADMAVVKIPFDVIPTGDISVSDSDINSYIAKNKAEFERKENTRVLEYVKLDVNPTPLDSMKCKEEINGIIAEFGKTENDSLFAISNNGFYSAYFAKGEELDESLQNDLANMKVGNVYGPYKTGKVYQAVKLVDKKIVPDSASASHIYKGITTPGNVQQLAAAEAFIDSLMIVAKGGSESFSTLAARHSDDVSTKNDGGDLGYFVQGAMLPVINDKAFISGEVGGLYKMKTQTGVHLIKITDQKYLTREPKYNIAIVNVPIVPSKETQNALYSTMVELLSAHPYLDDLRTAVDGIANLSMTTSNELDANDYIINGLQSGATSRDIVKWAFDEGVGVNDVSAVVYQFQDPQLYYNNAYVIAGLSAERAAGMPKADEVRSQVEFAVLNELKGKSILDKVNTSNLNALASQYEMEVDTLKNVSLLNSFVVGLGSEPEVVGAAFGQDVNATSRAILGNSGVFVVKTLGKTPAGDASNVAFIKRTITDRNRANSGQRMIDALRANVKIKDNRSMFY